MKNCEGVVGFVYVLNEVISYIYECSLCYLLIENEVCDICVLYECDD